jgi:hypothetical protein
MNFLKVKIKNMIRNFVIRILSDNTTEKTTSNTEHLDDINTDFSGPTCSMEDGCVSCGS